MRNFQTLITPFTREVDIEKRFRLESLDTAVAELSKTVEARESAVVVAPAGAGKSVVLRALKASLPEARYNVSYFKLADLTARDMCRQVAVSLNLPPASYYPRLVRLLEERFHDGFSNRGVRDVLIFDDAHEMRPDVLRLVRLLTNFEMDSKLIVSIILAGQLPLKTKLMDPALDDVRQRLMYFGEIRLLSKEETTSYLQHRLAIVGVSRSLFSTAAQEAIFEITKGNMRAIDRMALASMKVTEIAGRDTVEASDVAAARGSQWL